MSRSLVLGSVPASNVAATEADFVRSKARGEKFAHANEGRNTAAHKIDPVPSGCAQNFAIRCCTACQGFTLGCALRLVWRNFEWQRGSRLKRGQTLTHKVQAIKAAPPDANFGGDFFCLATLKQHIGNQLGEFCHIARLHAPAHQFRCSQTKTV